MIGTIPPPVMAAGGLLFAACAVATARWSFRPSDSARTRWLIVARDGCVGLVGVGIAVAPWVRLVGLGIGFIGVMGRLYFQIWASLMRRADRGAP